MATYELANDENGQPFELPAEAWGWRVRRLPLRGPGRPALMYWEHGDDKGKAMIVPLATTHAQLLQAAGPGRYRLEPVTQDRKEIKTVPAACTGPLMADEQEEEAEDDVSDEEDDDMPQGADHSLNALVWRLANTNAKVAEQALKQMTAVTAGVAQLGAVMNGVAQLLVAVHNTGGITRPPVYTLPQAEEHDDEEDECPIYPAAPIVDDGGMPELVRYAVKETINKVVPLIIDKLTSTGGGAVAGLPLEAFLDWRKAAVPAAVPSQPAAVQPTYARPVSYVAPQTADQRPPAPPHEPGGFASYHAPPWPGAISPQTVYAAPAESFQRVTSSGAPADPVQRFTSAAAPVSASAPSIPAAAEAQHVRPGTPIAVAPPGGAVHAGAAPSGDAPLGAVPAEVAAPVASSPPTPEEAAAMIDFHIMQVWKGLSPPERTRAGNLIAQLGSEARTAMLTELARLSVPEAVARARALIHDQSALTKASTTNKSGDV